MTDRKTYRKWGYRLNDGKVEGRIFDTVDGKLPKGWEDTPAGMKEADEA